MKTTFFDIENWKEIGATLARNKTRTFLTAFGIFWGTAMLAMLLGGAKGLENMLRRNFEGFATNTAILFPNRTTMSYQGFNKGTSWNLTATDEHNIRAGTPEIDAITGVNNIQTTVGRGKLSTSSMVTGVDSEYSKIFEPIIQEGRFINETDDILEKKICVIGKNIAATLFPDSSPIGEYIEVNGVYFKIVGVAYQTSEISIGDKIDDSIVAPMGVFRKAFNQGEDLGGMMFTAKNGVSPTELKPRLMRILTGNHKMLHPDDENAMFFMDVSEQFKMVDNLFMGISLLAFFVGAGTLIAGIIGVGNIMWVIVKERTQEIGIRRAIGAKPSDIITQVLSEGVALTTVAGIAGISFATVVLKVVEILATDEKGTPQFMLSFDGAMEIVLVFMILGIGAGFIPAVKAMKIKPIEAMNSK